MRKTQAEHLQRKLQQRVFGSVSQGYGNKRENKQIDLTKLKILCTAKETINKMKRQPKEWEKIFANDVTNRGILKIHQQPALQLLFSP